MALDHFISQVHLKNWYDPSLGERMHATRKSDLAVYQCNSASQCRIEDGNTNVYLEDHRGVEEFLRTIEGRYNVSVEELRNGRPTTDAIYSIAGFIAYVMTCSPAAMRINTPLFEGGIQAMTEMMERNGEFEDEPKIPGLGSISDMIKAGKIELNVDPKYPQAIGISGILESTAMLGNCHWDLLINSFQDTPYFTSDYPIANEQFGDPGFLNRIVPLTPDLALKIRPHVSATSAKGFGFEHFKMRRLTLARHEVVEVNRKIVRSAETVVFHSHNRVWVKGFVSKNMAYRVETWNEMIDTGNGILQWTRQDTMPLQT